MRFVNTLPYSKEEWARRPAHVQAGTTSPLPCGVAQYRYDAKEELLSGMTSRVSSSANLIYDTRAKLVDDIADQKSILLVTIAEAGKTLKMIADAAATLARVMKQLKRGRIVDAVRSLGINPKGKKDRPPALTYDDLKSRWLEYRYGWTPLLMDVRGIAEQFADTFIIGNAASDMFTVKVRKVHMEARRRQVYSPGGGAGYAIYPSLTYICDDEVTDVYTIWATSKVTNPQAKSLAEWGLVNPLAVAWELVPLSFVWDWFFSVGDYLSHLTAFTGLTLIDAGDGYSHTTERTLLVKNGWQSSETAVGHFALNRYDRQKITNFSDLKPDYLRLTHTTYWKHFVDAIALHRAIGRQLRIVK